MGRFCLLGPPNGVSMVTRLLSAEAGDPVE
jgi:hypothetical protein